MIASMRSSGTRAFRRAIRIASFVCSGVARKGGSAIKGAPSVGNEPLVQGVPSGIAGTGTGRTGRGPCGRGGVGEGSGVGSGSGSGGGTGVGVGGGVGTGCVW